MLSDLSGAKRKVLVDLGEGNDTFTLESGDNDVLGQSKFHLDITGGLGADETEFNFNAVIGSKLSISQSLGGGDDQSKFTFEDNIDFGSTVQINNKLGSGENALTIGLSGVGFNDVAEAEINVVGGDDPLNGDGVFVILGDDVGNGGVVSQLKITVDLRAGDDRFEAA